MSINAIGIIFSNMHDEEMHEITHCRTMGALPFGGRYRLIDFPLSSMHNSGITSVGVIAKSNYQSLLEHLGSGKEWDLSRKRGGLFIFPPFSRLATGIYKNKIEALYGILTFLKKSTSNYVVLTDCDAICNLNWQKPIDYHIKQKADITVLYYRVEPKNEIKNETVYHVSQNGFVTDIRINQNINEPCNIGTNMWITGRKFLINMLQDAFSHNLENIERDIFLKKLDQYKIAALKIDTYIRKANSICDFFHANMDTLNLNVREDLFFKNGPIHTKVYDTVPTKYGKDAKVQNSLISGGCVILGQVENSILFRGVKIGKGSKISNSIIMNNSNIGENVTLNYVLSDKNVIFNKNRTLMGCDMRPIYLSKGSNV